MDDLDELLDALQASSKLHPNGIQRNSMDEMSLPKPCNQSLNADYDFPDEDFPAPPPEILAEPKTGEENSKLGKNLNELDNLLRDLSSAQFHAQISQEDNGKIKPDKQNTMVKDPSVNTMLSQLEEDLESRNDTSNVYNKIRPDSTGGGSSGASSGTALSATQELDTLLESLNDFQISQQSSNAKPIEVEKQSNEEPIYSVPKKWKDRELKALSSSDEQPANNVDQLDNMLGNLQQDMIKQGVQMIPKGHCAACTNPIIGQVITALGFMWHPEHFVCYHCKKALGTNTFFERDGKPYCEHDYHLLYSPQCAACSDPILDHCLTALNKTWHPEHFCCTNCGQSFGTEGFHEKDGKPFCRKDYFEMFAPKCSSCDNVIRNNYISALNKHWHPECFVCQECRKPFGKGSFFEYEKLPYCETDFYKVRGSICAVCQTAIAGRCVTAMNKKFHPDHFRCQYCNNVLNKGTFKEQDSKPYCHACFIKLHGL
ncbi:DgyrCDS2829 [Dimorphilus gyrociliatus]|uniref:DgyrCDS2829 n=1 Tax=Dimorphilus gyrociliatus TaxID=2664684 RepID=A0A7I8VGJ1_9ANNE|nr:DgyrCDS2829 [Dimorphilus gyrociliatus]